jgi:DNA-binding response OmpR family regulator
MCVHPRVLIVEDEPMILMDLVETVTELGYRVVDKAETLAKGMVLARDLDLDGAVLDVNLAGQTSTGIADILRERGVPFLLLTGYTKEGLPKEHRENPHLEKPWGPASLSRALDELMHPHGSIH